MGRLWAARSSESGSKDLRHEPTAESRCHYRARG